MPKLIKGSQLNADQKKQVKAAFIYRLTTENGYPKRNPCKARVPAVSDEQWISEHSFYFRKDGVLSCRPNRAEPDFMAD